MVIKICSIMMLVCLVITLLSFVASGNKTIVGNISLNFFFAFLFIGIVRIIVKITMGI